MSTVSGMRPHRSTYAGIFAVAAAALMLEIGLTRIFSVTMWYHFAFFAISVALFGMTAGALIVQLLPDRFSDADVRTRLWQASAGFAIAIAVCFPLLLLVPFTPRLTVGGIASVVATCVLIAVPFVWSGIVVCLVLTRFPGSVHRLYAADLLGAGLGCMALLVLFSWFDGPSMIILIAGLAALGGVGFARAAGSRQAVLGLCVLSALLAGVAVTNTALLRSGDEFLGIRWVKEERDPPHILERWNAFSRITVEGDPDDPNQDSLNLVIDGTAGTRIGRFDGDELSTDWMRGLIQNLPHHIRPNSDVFVIGAGGGTDLLSSIEFAQPSVTGAEINGLIVDTAYDTYGDYSGNLDDRPDVNLVNDEARSYLARSDQHFGIIQISLIDTWAATGAGAFALTENSLYTTEAWALFLDHLTDDGILGVTRFYRTNDTAGNPVEPLETYRTVALASEVLTQRGSTDPRQHLAVYTQPTPLQVNLATVLTSPTPLSADDRAELDAVAAENGFSPALTDTLAVDPILEALVQPGGPGPGLDLVEGDISPPTDNRPFFFQMADLDTLLSGAVDDDVITRPVFVLGLLTLTVVALAAVCLALPWILRRRIAPVDSTAPPGGGGTRWPYYAYFGGIGLGFLILEIAQLQRLSSFLGHPTYGLAVVLFSVLVFSGVGSMLSERLVPAGRRGTTMALGALLVVAAVSGFVTPHVIDATTGATTPLRIVVAVVLLAPMATLMGMPFSLGMRAAADAGTVPTTYLWAINGALSVCASVLAVAIALFFGITAAFTTGLVAYLVSLIASTRFAEISSSAVADEDPRPASLVTDASV